MYSYTMPSSPVTQSITAAHIYSELEGSELERSANMFDLSFVPTDMAFDDEPRWALAISHPALLTQYVLQR